MVIEVKVTLAYIGAKLASFAPIIVTVLGLIKYQVQIFEFLCKKKYQYRRREHAKVGEFFEMQIPMIRGDYTLAFMLHERLEKKIKKR